MPSKQSLLTYNALNEEYPLQYHAFFMRFIRVYWNGLRRCMQSSKFTPICIKGMNCFHTPDTFSLKCFCTLLLVVLILGSFHRKQNSLFFSLMFHCCLCFCTITVVANIYFHGFAAFISDSSKLKTWLMTLNI